MSNGNLANSIIPGRVVEIAGAASTGTITVVLLN
jgi:acyl CoA:acetate/3-ketoacid CoA transferase beta subunit